MNESVYGRALMVSLVMLAQPMAHTSTANLPKYTIPTYFFRSMSTEEGAIQARVRMQIHKVYDGDDAMPTCARCKLETGNWCDVCKVGLCHECELQFRVCAVCEGVPKPFCDGPSCNGHVKWKCGRCRSRGYCSRECQRNDWSCEYKWHGNHKAVCKEQKK